MKTTIVDYDIMNDSVVDCSVDYDIMNDNKKRKKEEELKETKSKPLPQNVVTEQKISFR